MCDGGDVVGFAEKLLDRLHSEERESKMERKKMRKDDDDDDDDRNVDAFSARKDYCSTPKLLLNFYKKKNYFLHVQALKLYESLGMRITKVHQILKFKQSPWLKKYIVFNSEKRAQATSTFEKDFSN